ncbi:hypothetical protein ACH47X_25755 [Promicromonospora kroppenstedtii]|uniref:Uncharacterized protein n=1 Tax=Promicromonospora kroppenstedtii TaxID=440482 RepID=A0ABW7XSR3_9MICO
MVDVAAGATESERRRRGRTAWVVGAVVVAALVAGIGGWQYAARNARIVAEGATLSGGMAFPDCLPRMALAVYGTGDDVVVGQTVRNPSRWPVTVISSDPEVFRFEALSDDPADDTTVSSADGAAPAGASGTVVLPPGRGATMWIVDPQRYSVQDASTVWYEFDGVPVTLRTLGVAREASIRLPGTLYVGGGKDGERLGAALQEACDA